MTLQQTAGDRPNAPAPGTTVSVVGRSHVGKVRQNNEDAFVIDPERGLGVVADGMGGLNRGEVASQIVVDSVAEVVRSGLTPAEGLRVSHTRVRGMIAPGSEERMGATAVAVSVNGREARVAWVGDSRAYLFRSGKLKQLTKDHSFVQELLDLGMINSEEAAAHPNRSVVTRAIGVKELADIEVDETAVELQQRDRLLLCSDGLCGFLKEDSIQEELQGDRDDGETVARLIERTLAESEAADNITVVLISVKG